MRLSTTGVVRIARRYAVSVACSHTVASDGTVLSGISSADESTTSPCGSGVGSAPKLVMQIQLPRSNADEMFAVPSSRR